LSIASYFQKAKRVGHWMCFHSQVKVWGGTCWSVRHKVLSTLPNHRVQVSKLPYLYGNRSVLWNVVVSLEY